MNQDQDQTDPLRQTPDIHAENSVDAVKPTPGVSREKHSKKLKLIIGVSVAMLVVGCGVAGAIIVSRGSKDAGFTANRAGSIPLPGESIQNDYKVYKRVDETFSPAKSAVYTLTDKDGTKLTEVTAGVDLQMVTPVGSDKFLLLDDEAIGKDAYKILSKDGLVTFSAMPESMENRASSGRSSPIQLTGFAEDVVAYQYCKDWSGIVNEVDTYECDLRTVNVVSGEEKIMQLSGELKTYNAQLLTFGTDRKHAYFLGMSEANQKAFDKEAEKITDGGLYFESNPIVDKLYELTMTQSILKLDLEAQKIVDIKDVKTPYTYYQKFWLSPNGEHLVYSKGGERGALQYVRVRTGEAGAVALPLGSQATEPWGSTTVTYDPLFSPDGQSMAYVTYDADTMREAMGIISLETKTAKEYAREPQTNQGSGGTRFFDNMRWLGSNRLEMQAGRENSLVDMSQGVHQLDTTYGLLLGVHDGFH